MCFPVFLFTTKIFSPFQKFSRVLSGQFSVNFSSSKVFSKLLEMKQMFIFSSRAPTFCIGHLHVFRYS